MKNRTLLTLGLLLALGSASAVQAQALYRIVGPNGKVTYTDTPPVSGGEQKSVASGTAGSGGAALPYELQQVASRYPVTLYTSGSCGPCDGGRSYLSARGIPFNERTIATTEDAQALQRLSGQVSLPLLTIGGQQIKGFSESEWGQYLDAAGYPAASQLPSSYHPPAATPLAPVAQRAVPKAAPTKQEPALPPVDSKPPAGIRF